MKDEITVLREARERIAAGWCQGWFAQDAWGIRTGIHSPDAVRFCIKGAIFRSNSDASGDVLERLRRLIGTIDPELEPYEDAVVRWQDDSARTQSDVLALVARAIAAAEAEAVA
jgi:hypothetical protein